MTRCNEQCTPRLTKDGETFCFVHGTTEFKQQPFDIVDESDIAEANEIVYSPAFLYRAYKMSPLTMEEIANILGISYASMRAMVGKYEKDTQRGRADIQTNKLLGLRRPTYVPSYTKMQQDTAKACQV